MQVRFRPYHPQGRARHRPSPRERRTSRRLSFSLFEPIPDALFLDRVSLLTSVPPVTSPPRLTSPLLPPFVAIFLRSYISSLTTPFSHPDSHRRGSPRFLPQRGEQRSGLPRDLRLRVRCSRLCSLLPVSVADFVLLSSSALLSLPITSCFPSSSLYILLLYILLLYSLNYAQGMFSSLPFLTPELLLTISTFLVDSLHPCVAPHRSRLLRCWCAPRLHPGLPYVFFPSRLVNSLLTLSPPFLTVASLYSRRYRHHQDGPLRSPRQHLLPPQGGLHRLVLRCLHHLRRDHLRPCPVRPRLQGHRLGPQGSLRPYLHPHLDLGHPRRQRAHRCFRNHLP